MHTFVLDGLHAERRRELMRAADRARRTPLIMAANASQPPPALRHLHVDLGGVLARLLRRRPAETRRQPAAV